MFDRIKSFLGRSTRSKRPTIEDRKRQFVRDDEKHLRSLLPVIKEEIAGGNPLLLCAGCGWPSGATFADGYEAPLFELLVETKVERASFEYRCAICAAALFTKIQAKVATISERLRPVRESELDGAGQRIASPVDLDPERLFEQGDVAALTRALEAGFNPNAGVHWRRHRSIKPLTIAAYHQKRDVIRLLLAHGADVNATLGGLGVTALHWACQSKSQVDTVKLLVESGASVDVEDWDSRTPLYHANQCGTRRVCEYLKSVGAR